MKKLLIVLAMGFLLAGCLNSLSIPTPLGSINGDTRPTATAYIDTDVTIKDGVIKSDDTTMISITLPESTDSQKELFNNFMIELTKIFKEKVKVYRGWVEK
jgi:ABC-type glycerol-3-phosphate transport system substrate-binding protein